MDILYMCITLSFLGIGLLVGYFGGYSIATEDMAIDSYDTRISVTLDDREYIFEARDYYFDLLDSNDKINVTVNLN